MIIALNKVDNLKPGHIVTQMKVAGSSATSMRSIRSREDEGRRRRVAAATSCTCCRRVSPLPARGGTDQTDEDRITEMIREKALELTRDEVPHSISVELDELEDKVVRAFVLVETSRRSRSSSASAAR